MVGWTFLALRRGATRRPSLRGCEKFQCGRDCEREEPSCEARRRGDAGTSRRRRNEADGLLPPQDRSLWISSQPLRMTGKHWSAEKRFAHDARRLGGFAAFVPAARIARIAERRTVFTDSAESNTSATSA